MYFELQLSSEVFGCLFEYQLKAYQPCLSYMEFNFDGELLVVDKIEIVDQTNIQRDPGPPRRYPTLLSFKGNIAQPNVPYFLVKPTLAITFRKSAAITPMSVRGR